MDTRRTETSLERASRICGENAVAGHSLKEGGDALLVWARADGKVISSDFMDKLPCISEGTSEHVVYLETTSSRVVKVTNSGFYGQIPGCDGSRQNALPHEYLARMCLHNEVFQTDIELEGIIEDSGPSLVLFEEGGLPRIVISQSIYLAEDSEAPAPSITEIAQYMEGLGFRNEPNWFYGWYRDSDKLAVIDAKEDNFILTSSGIQAIDLQLIRYE